MQPLINITATPDSTQSRSASKTPDARTAPDMPFKQVLSQQIRNKQAHSGAPANAAQVAQQTAKKADEARTKVTGQDPETGTQPKELQTRAVESESPAAEKRDNWLASLREDAGIAEKKTPEQGLVDPNQLLDWMAQLAGLPMQPVTPPPQVAQPVIEKAPVAETPVADQMLHADTPGAAAIDPDLGTSQASDKPVLTDSQKPAPLEPDAAFAARLAASMPSDKQTSRIAIDQDALAATTQAAPLQHAPTALVENAAAATQSLQPRVASPAWNQALGQRIVWMASNGEQNATLTLNPPDLGPLQVVIRVQDAQASADFTASHPEVLQAIEAAMPKLRDMMQNAGLDLNKTSVGLGNPGQQHSQTQQQGQPSHQHTPDNQATHTGATVSLETAASGSGLVDTFA